MPKQLKEIKGFHAGTISSPDAQDIPDDSNFDSLNLDNFDSKGFLKGRKGDEWYHEGSFSPTGTSPIFSSAKLTIAADNTNQNQNLRGSYFLINLPSGSFYVWFDVVISPDDPGTIPMFILQDQLDKKVGIRVYDNEASTDDGHDESINEAISITDTNTIVTKFVVNAINTAKAQGIIRGINLTHTAPSNEIIFTMTEYGAHIILEETNTGDFNDVFTISDEVIGSGVHGQPVVAASINKKDENSIIWYDEQYGICRIQDTYSNNPRINYGNYLPRTKRELPNATMVKKAQEVHIGIGTEVDDRPLWAGYLNLGNQVYEKGSYHETLAELVPPGGEYASVSRDFSQIIKHPNDSMFSYAIVKGQDRIHRININEGDDDYGLIETCNPLGFTIQCINICRSEPADNGIFIFAYASFENTDLYNLEGSAGQILKILVNTNGNETTFLFDKATLSIVQTLNIEFDDATKLRLEGNTPDDHWPGEFGSLPNEPAVYAIAETECKNISDDNLRYMIWILLAPEGSRIEEGAWGDLHQTAGPLQKDSPHWGLFNYSGNDKIYPFLYSSGFANESGLLENTASVQSLTFHDRSIGINAYETRFPGYDSSGSNLEHTGNYYKTSTEGYEHSRNNLYWAYEGFNAPRNSRDRTYYCGIKTGSNYGTIKHYGAFDCNWHVRPYFHFNIEVDGTYDSGSSYAAWIDNSTGNDKPHFIDIKYNDIGLIDRNLNNLGYFSNKDAVCRLQLNNTEATYDEMQPHPSFQDYDFNTNVTAGTSYVTYGLNPNIVQLNTGNTNLIKEGAYVYETTLSEGDYDVFPENTRVVRVISSTLLMLSHAPLSTESAITVKVESGVLLQADITNTDNYRWEVREKICEAIINSDRLNPYTSTSYYSRTSLLAAYYSTEGSNEELMQYTVAFVGSAYQVGTWANDDIKHYNIADPSTGAYTPEFPLDNVHFQFSPQMNAKLGAGSPPITQGDGTHWRLDEDIDQFSSSPDIGGGAILHTDVGTFDEYNHTDSGSQAEGQWYDTVLTTDPFFGNDPTNNLLHWNDGDAGQISLASSDKTLAYTTYITSFDQQRTGWLQTYQSYIVKIVCTLDTASFKVKVGDSDESRTISTSGTHYISFMTKDFSADTIVNDVSIGVTDGVNTPSDGTEMDSLNRHCSKSVLGGIYIIPQSEGTSIIITEIELHLGTYGVPESELANSYNLTSVNSSSKLLIRNPGMPSSTNHLAGLEDRQLDGDIFTGPLNLKMGNSEDTIDDLNVGPEAHGRHSAIPFSLEQYDNGSCETTRRHTVSFGMCIASVGNSHDENTQADHECNWYDALYVQRVSEIPNVITQTYTFFGSSSNNYQAERWGGWDVMRCNENAALEAVYIKAKAEDGKNQQFKTDLRFGKMLHMVTSATNDINYLNGISKNNIGDAPKLTEFSGKARIHGINHSIPGSDDEWDLTGTVEGTFFNEEGGQTLDDDSALNVFLSTAAPGASSGEIDNSDDIFLGNATIMNDSWKYNGTAEADGDYQCQPDWNTIYQDGNVMTNILGYSIWQNTWTSPNDKTTDTVTSVGRKVLTTWNWSVDGQQSPTAHFMWFSPADAKTSSAIGKLGGFGVIPGNHWQEINMDDNKPGATPGAIIPTTGEGLNSSFKLHQHATYIQKYVDGGMDPYEESIDDSGTNYQFKIQTIDRHGSKALFDHWVYYDPTFNGRTVDFGYPESTSHNWSGIEYIGSEGTDGITNSGNALIGHKIVNQLSTFIKSVVDSGDQGVTNAFEGNDGYRFRISYIYDGYQESPLSISHWDHTIGSNDTGKLFVTFALDFANPRITHLNLYRVAGFSESSDSLYRQVGSYSLKQGWTATDQNGMMVWEKTEEDNGFQGATYESINGISELITSTMVNYELSALLNDYHFIARCYAPQIQGGENFLFRSKRGNFDQFDWSRDFLVLPEHLTAMASFKNRIFVFSRSNMYTINHSMQIEDTYEGVGCLGPKSIKTTTNGLCFADDNAVYLLTGGAPKNISIPISDKYLGDLADVPEAEVVVGYHSETSSFLINTKTDSSYVYNTLAGRWDIWTTPTENKVTVYFSGGKNELFSFDRGKNILVRNVSDFDNLKEWKWQSKRFTMDADTQNKTFKKIHIKGLSEDKVEKLITSDLLPLSYNTKINHIANPSITYTLTSSGKKSTWLQITINESDKAVDSIGIIYRVGPVK